jgi:hypothetical protein
MQPHLQALLLLLLKLQMLAQRLLALALRCCQPASQTCEVLWLLAQKRSKQNKHSSRSCQHAAAAQMDSRGHAVAAGGHMMVCHLCRLQLLLLLAVLASLVC